MRTNSVTSAIQASNIEPPGMNQYQNLIALAPLNMSKYLVSFSDFASIHIGSMIEH
ncbi:hypothetical protein THF1C08_50090 [Vibrio jasicida]|uniref:Uncharacterized protein n=1 Tax=Vibrio jasicida TaxID=766224 RepID=A0AAU9QX88_9VIBR|nr:hypothetical protein THF1C08_50090 [Vibrio jasicida]CAH1601844.1 hypothetical protein THF1A12_50258 [Vibrio jasicida]